MDNTQISCFIMKNEGKETILMLHPAFADHTIFKTQIAYFKNDYQLILVDLPGHGNCNNIESKVTIKDTPEILNQILFDNNIEACHLVGVSLGSLVAQAFADRYPDRVKSVIIVGGYSIHKANKRVLKGQRKEGLKWILYILFSMKKFKDYVISVSCRTDLGRDMFAQGIQHFRRRSFSLMAGMNTFFINKDTPMPYALLIVVGEHDRKLVQEAAVELHELEKKSQLVLLPGAGHCANVDAPNEFNRVVGNFLSVI
jgi:3-oxoadipate enol-lactonase